MPFQEDHPAYLCGHYGYSLTYSQDTDGDASQVPNDQPQYHEVQ